MDEWVRWPTKSFRALLLLKLWWPLHSVRHEINVSHAPKLMGHVQPCKEGFGILRRDARISN